MANAQQIESWDGPGGEQWVQDAERYDRMNGPFGERIVERVAVQAGERALDVGCGNGAVSLALARARADVTGVDISGPMLDEARRRADAAGLDVSFVKADAQVHDFDRGSFDAAVSRFGVMFFDDPVAAFTNVGGALRSGGRLVFSCWQELLKNEWLIVPSMAALAFVPMPELGGPDEPGPFAFADPDRLRSVLGDAGFVDIGIDEMSEPMVMGDSVEDTVGFFQRTELAATLFKDVDASTAEAAWSAIADALRPHERDEGVVLQGSAWLVTAKRP